MVIDVGALLAETGGYKKFDCVFDLDLNGVDGLLHFEPVSVCVKVKSLQPGKLSVIGEGSVCVSVRCDVCLCPFETRIAVSFEEVFANSKFFSADDLPNGTDIELFSGNVIPLNDLIKMHIVAALPLRFVCKEDCKGLCVSCGHNLNDGACDCGFHVI